MSDWGKYGVPKISEEPMMRREDSFCSEALPPSDDADGASVLQAAESSNTNIVKKETQEVYHLKIIVLSILFVSAIVTATCVYFFISKKEDRICVEQFQSNAAKILNAVGNSIDQTLIPLDSLAVELVSYARDSNSPWPFVTLPEFGLRMSKSLPLTDAMMIQYLPLVQPWQRADWETYVSRNNAWVNETMKLQETWDGYYGPITYNWTANNIIFGDAGDIEANVRYVYSVDGIVQHKIFLTKYFLLIQSPDGARMGSIPDRGGCTFCMLWLRIAWTAVFHF
jgi:hypothetical protein